MSKVVKANVPQTVLLQQLAEIAAEIPGIKNVPHYIHEHIAVVFPVVAVAADPLVFLLLLLQGQQLLPDIVDQRKRAQTGFRLGAILADDLILAVYLGICYDVSDGDGIALKVDGVPSQAQSLAAPEPVERGDLDGDDLKKYLTELFWSVQEEKIDSIVLGCTHYPFAKKAIEQIVGKEVAIFDGGNGTAREMQRRLMEAGLCTDATQKGTVQFLNSRDTKEEKALCEFLLNR